ncbi:uncharacterized protein LOC103313425 [Tribolium castaneum]|uniref:Uncharacterized protein n=1 Tax=Tribolium castaneum TaxID=7070 RepID=D2A6D9_TRICA|nr:PREDICTED: uncharacterized protein LOC103313425 [Tribolium castaneum]EFA04937.1 hypothetical protein TcasGA2_TC015004 [Tribolium castaneum]|eukprot:XP_008194872.1 PREDICTED: uncharacterized protein LOC103313425 [Tribolium castaneum]
MAAKNLRKIQSLLSRNYCKKSDTSSIWNYFKKGDKKPALERCRKRQVRRQDPDLSAFGGQAFRTCGKAYVVQRDVIPPGGGEHSEEDRVLMKIEADLSNKDNVCDPMPPFKSVEQRMIDLSERKLHPFYKRFMSLPNKNFVGEETPTGFAPYKCKSGPVKPEEIPENLQFNKQLLERKNIFADFKRVELPKQMVVRIVEMEQNRKPTLEKKGKKSD